MARPRSAGLRSRGDAHLVTCLAARHFLADAIRCGALTAYRRPDYPPQRGGNVANRKRRRARMTPMNAGIRGGALQRSPGYARGYAGLSTFS